jgi:hypothetical protein
MAMQSLFTRVNLESDQTRSYSIGYKKILIAKMEKWQDRLQYPVKGN